MSPHFRRLSEPEKPDAPSGSELRKIASRSRPVVGKIKSPA